MAEILNHLGWLKVKKNGINHYQLVQDFFHPQYVFAKGSRPWDEMIEYGDKAGPIFNTELWSCGM